MADNLSSIVFDFGACYSKIGEAAEEVPRVVLPSMYCSTDEDFLMCAADTYKLEHYFGFDAVRREGLLPQQSFFDYERNVAHPDIVGRFLHQSMYDNFSNSETGYQGVILLDKPSTSTQTKKRLAEVFLEWNKLQRFTSLPDYAATLFATGKSTGIVVSCGQSTTYAAAVYDGIPSPVTISETSFNAQLVETQYKEVLRDIGYSLKGKGGSKLCEASRINTRAFLEDYALVRLADSIKDTHKVKLPDGTQIEVPQADITAPFEPYFNEKTFGNPSLQQLVQKAVSQVSPFFRDQLYANVVVEGGITKVPNFCERLLTELSADGSSKVKLANTVDRLLAPWIGAARLKDWIDDNKLWFDIKALSEKGIERAMAEIARSF